MMDYATDNLEENQAMERVMLLADKLERVMLLPDKLERDKNQVVQVFSNANGF